MELETEESARTAGWVHDGTHRKPSAEQRRAEERPLNWDSVGAAGCNPGAGGLIWGRRGRANAAPRWGCAAPMKAAARRTALSCLRVITATSKRGFAAKKAPCFVRSKKTSIPDHRKAEEATEMSPRRLQNRTWRSTIRYVKNPPVTLSLMSFRPLWKLLSVQNAPSLRSGQCAEIKP